MIRKRKSTRGFTLIELLIAMVVVSVIGSVIIVIFYSVLRGTNKANTLIVVRQNGNYAISQMTKMIRDAQAVNSPTCPATPPSPSTQIILTQQDSSQITISCSANSITVLDSSTGQTSTLIDTAAVSATCTFVCTKAASSPVPLVEINLRVNQKDASTTDEKKASEDFHTSVALRSMN